MNWDRVHGTWKQLKGRTKVGCARVMGDPSVELTGRREMLAGKLQVAYGVGRDKAHRQVHDWRKTVQESADEMGTISHRAAR